MRVLLAEDDPVLGHAVKVGLNQDGLHVYWTRDGLDALCAFTQGEYDVLVIDLELPGLHGLDLLHRVRQTNWRVPVVIITAHGEVADRVRGLNLGADDYLSKPFDLDELLARLRALARRAGLGLGAALAVGELRLDLREHSVSLRGTPVWLSAREFAVLRLLMQSVGRPLSKLQIEEHLSQWGDESLSDKACETNLAEVYIHNLRKKIGRDRIQTLRGHGYLLAQ